MLGSSTLGWRSRVALPLLLGVAVCLLPFTARAQLSGTYTIGSGGNYATFSAAVTALTTSGVSGAVTFSVLSGTYNETFTIPAITGASATNTITFDGGTGNASTRILTYDVTSSYGAVITLNDADYVKFKNLTINSTNATYGYGFLFTNSADYNEISNCVINLPTNTTSAYHIGVCASSTTSYSSYGDWGSFNLIKDNTINSGYYGIRWNGPSSSSDYTTSQGNQFVGNTLTDWYYYGMYLYRGGSVLVKGNRAVQRQTGTYYTDTGYAYYLYYLSNGPEISHNYGWSSAYAFYPYYINNAYASTANRAKIHNNMGVANGTSTVYGMYLYNGKYFDAAYNSVYVTTSSTSSSAYGIYSYTSSATTYPGNKFVNNSIMIEGGGTQYFVYQNYSASFTQFDYNLYYSVGGTSQYWSWNSTTYASFAALQSGTSGAHDNSVYGNPDWFSATDLHSTSMAGYNAGTPITGITDDFDGDTRSTTTPDIGADEYLLTNMAYSASTTAQPNTSYAYAGMLDQEIIRIDVTVTGSLSPISATSFTLNTSGTTSTSNITNAKLYYTARDGNFATGTQFGSTIVSPSGSFTITGSQALQGPGTNYFWLAYDIAASAPSGNFVDGQASSVTVGGTAYTPTVQSPTGSREIVQPMNGIYTIDPTGSGSRNFTSFGAAITALNLYGVNGATTFQVAAATYTEQLTIGEITGASASNTITFDGGTGNAASRNITYSVATSYGSVITLDGADYVTFKNLTVNSTNSSYGYCFLFTNSADYNEISNCVLNLPSNSSTGYHTGICASTTSSYSTTGDHGSYNLIKDNEINGGYYGIRWNGSGSTDYVIVQGNEFIGNTVQDWYYSGMYLYYIGGGTKVNDNHVTQRRSGTYTSTSGYGMYIYYPNDGPEIIGNYVNSAYYGLYAYRINYYQSASSNRGKVWNNMVMVNGTGTYLYGLNVGYCRYADVVYNSVSLVGTPTYAYGLYDYGESSSYDNKFVNNFIAFDGTATYWRPIYNYYFESVSQYDYNAYYTVNPTQSQEWYWDGTSYASLTALKAATTTVHDNSVEGNPYYFDKLSDLHSNSHVGYQAGTPFAAVTDDYDGEARGAAPCIGADEYSAPPPENDMAVLEVMLNTADSKWAHVENPAEHAVKAVVGNTGLSANPATLSVTYKVGSAPASEFDGVNQTFTPGWVKGKATVEFTQKVTGLVAGDNPTVYARMFWTGDEVAANNTAMDNAFIEIVKVHGFENFEKMEVGENPLTRYPGYLDLPWEILDNNGGATLAVTAGAGNGGNGLAMNAAGQAADEWVVMPGADLLGGSSYRFGFDFRNWGGSPVTIEAAWGDTPDPNQMTVFATFANIAPGGWVTAKQLGGNFNPYFNTPLNDGTYFVAMRFTTIGTTPYFSIDNIKLDDNPSPPPKIAFGLPGTDRSTFIDNPTSKLTILANFKQPGIINRTYEVQNKIDIYGANGDFLWDVETSTPWIKLTKETPDPTAQGYNLTPPRPRQFQTFTMSVNTAGLAAGTHLGEITFYGILFNDDFPPPANGLVATNEPLTIQVELIITNAGTKTGGFIEQTISTPLTVPGSPYDFIDPKTGDPIATVVVTNGQIDMMTIRAYPNQLPQNLQRKLFVKRYWQITHTGTGWTADITFPYADIEASMINDKLQLRGIRQPVMLGAWEDPIMGTGSVSDPATNRVTVVGFNDMNIGGNIALSQPYMVAGKSAAEAGEFTLGQNYPNPFNPSTSIMFTVGEERSVRLAVYDALGAEVAVLVNEVLTPGRYEVNFDASDLPSGTYVYRMLSGDFVSTQRMTLSK